MARTKPIRRSYGAGEWGRNRVRVFPDPKTGLFQIEWRDNGRRLTRSLKHRDWRRAKRQADEFAAGYLGPELHRKAEAESEPLTLETLFDIYGEEVTPAKVERVRHRDRSRDEDVSRTFFGRDRRPETLSQRDWDRFIRARRAGRVGASGKPGVRPDDRIRDLKFLIAVFNWAAKSRDEQGRPLLLEANPLRGLKTPKEKNPTRVVLSDEEYRALLRVSRRGRLAVPGRACARARDRTPHRRHPPGAMVGHRPANHAVARELRNGSTARRSVERNRVLGIPRDRGAPVSRAEGPRYLVEQGRARSRESSRSSQGWSRSVAEAGTRSGGSLLPISWTCRSRCSANSAAGRTAQTVLRCYQQASSDLYLFVNVSLTGFVGPVPAV